MLCNDIVILLIYALAVTQSASALPAVLPSFSSCNCVTFSPDYVLNLFICLITVCSARLCCQQAGHTEQTPPPTRERARGNVGKWWVALLDSSLGCSRRESQQDEMHILICKQEHVASSLWRDTEDLM